MSEFSGASPKASRHARLHTGLGQATQGTVCQVPTPSAHLLWTLKVWKTPGECCTVIYNTINMGGVRVASYITSYITSQTWSLASPNKALKRHRPPQKGAGSVGYWERGTGVHSFSEQRQSFVEGKLQKLDVRQENFTYQGIAPEHKKHTFIIGQVYPRTPALAA